MPDESALLVPLRSNASTLLTGRPIAAMRQRLKYASLLHGHVLLEDGVLRVQAGAGGSWAVVEPVRPQDRPRWQTPVQRHASQAEPFQINIAPESSPGVTAGPFRPVMASDGEVSWRATLRPFADELPPDTDWVTFVRTSDPAGEAGRAASQWTWADEHNSALEDAITGRFVRGVIIKNANRDLAIAAAEGLGVMADPLHMQVAIQRFNDEHGWRLGGYSVPVLYPQVGGLPWDAIADLRREPNIARFRAVLREVEEETASEAASGDFEAAAHHAYERHLADASGRLDGVGAVAKRTGLGLVVGGGIGVAASPITGPLGIVVTTVAGAAAGTIADVRNTIRQRRSRGWIEVHRKITGTSA